MRWSSVSVVEALHAVTLAASTCKTSRIASTELYVSISPFTSNARPWFQLQTTTKMKLTSSLKIGTFIINASTRGSDSISGASLAHSITVAEAFAICPNLVQLTLPSRISFLTSLMAVISWRYVPLDFF